MRPFPPVPPSFLASAVFPLRSRPVRTPLLGLCFFLSLLQASASQWLPLCRSALRLVSSASLVTPGSSNLRFLRSSDPAPRSPLPLSRFLRFVLLPRSPSHRHLSVSLVRFAPDLVLGSAALLFTAPGFASQLLLPFACLPSRVQAFPLTSFVPLRCLQVRLSSVRFRVATSAPFVCLRFQVTGHNDTP